MNVDGTNSELISNDFDRDIQNVNWSKTVRVFTFNMMIKEIPN